MEMVPIAATGSLENDHTCKELGTDITIVMDNDLICDESIIDVSAAMEPAGGLSAASIGLPVDFAK